ncbi:protein rep [Bradyrhizobium sp. CIAT3101]|uniref:protein rep n=1 Tax=Bradyrhizobium sp. CIAT3101 TaxID=439387 RepID=UPI0024B03FDA|nr:protein rep [Bradyrhizobium sp. CIAT3101]WFU79393.1 protein rep [Bradyrhizobium sp. CIAT3101]
MFDISHFDVGQAETTDWTPTTPLHQRLSGDDCPYFCEETTLPDRGKRLKKVGQRNYKRMHCEKLALADSLEAAGRDDVANLLRNCCSQLFVDRYTKGVRVRGLNECKHPLCPTAQLARARRQYGATVVAVEKLLSTTADMQGLLLTLTVQSCPAHELNYRLGEIIRAFGRLMSFTKVKQAVKAYVRSVEFTRNAITSLWHVHIHACLFVSKAEYFRRSSKIYISQEQWAALWRKALRATYDPVVDIRALNGLVSPLDERGRDALCEVIKYQVKPGSLVYWESGRAYAVGRQVPELYRKPGSDKLEPMLNVPVIAFCDAVKGRRLVATSRNLQGDETLDFTDDPKGEVKAIDLGEFICTEIYQWHTRGRDADFFLVGRTFNDPDQPGKQGGFAMGP